MSDEPPVVGWRAYVDLRVATIKERYDDLRTADELRYSQLREAQQIALTAALQAAEKAVQTALLAAKEAVVKAEIATEKRLEGLNELRQGVATKDALDALDMRLRDLKESVTQIQSVQVGRAGGLRDYIGWILAVITVAGFIIVLVTRK